MTLYPPSETIQLWISRACHLHFPSFPILLPSCLDELAILNWDFVILQKNTAYYLAMDPKKGRRVRKREVPTDIVP